MTPIVFCASPVPCARLTSEAETVWPCRKYRFAVSSSERRVSVYAAKVARPAMTPQITGDSSAGSTIFENTLSKCTPDVPTTTQTAPISPPNRACELLDGRPSNQVARFQRMAPTRPAKMIAVPLTAWLDSLSSSTMPPEMVLATAVETKAPTTFSTPEITTATRGLRAPVAIDVAIALAVSWKPFVKSNASAVAITTTTRKETSTAHSGLGIERLSGHLGSYGEPVVRRWTFGERAMKLHAQRVSNLRT